MTKEEALDLALAALEKLKQAFFKNASTAKEIEQGCDRGYEDYEAEFVEPALKAITAIKKARALDKMAENARELGLDYEPAKYSDIVSDGGMDPRNQFDVPPTAQPAPVHKPYRPLQDNGSQYFGDSWDTLPTQSAPVGVTTGCASHEGFFTVVFRSQQPIPDGTDLYTTPPAQPAPVQDSTCNETLRAQDKAYPRTCKKCGKGPCIGAPKQPPSQPAPVQGLPFGVGGGLVAIKTLLSRDPCVHANTAIEMIDSILKEHPVAKQQWVGLTDEERMDCIFATNWSKKPLMDTAKLIEAKLKEKNA
jgi:hypothetical protein